jgi:hypothetical protein
MTQTTQNAGMPAFIECIGPGHTLFAEACVHIRAGYVFHPDRPVMSYPNGNVHFILVQGNPGQAAIDLAKESRELAQRQQAARYEEDVQRAAKAMMEQAKREEIAKQLADAEAANARAMAKLKREADAALAAIAAQ